MKKYIKPNTEMHNIELTQMIADSPVTYEEQGGTQLSRENDMTNEITSNSLWDEEE